MSLPLSAKQRHRKTTLRRVAQKSRSTLPWSELMRVCDLEHKGKHCGRYGLQSQQKSDMVWGEGVISVDRTGSHFLSRWFTGISVVYFLCVFFKLKPKLAKKSLAADESKITHSNPRPPNIVSIDKYSKYLSKKKKLSTQSCPHTVHYGDMSLFFSFIDSRCRITQCKLNNIVIWSSVLCCVFVKKENLDSLNKVTWSCLCFGSRCDTCLDDVRKAIRGRGRGAGKGNHWKFKASFFWCNEDADDSIYSHIYSRVLYTGSHTLLLHGHKTLISCLPSCPNLEETNNLSRSRKEQKDKKITKYIQGERWLSPVCPGRRARPWPGSGACSGSPWCSAACRAPSASSPASGCTPPWDRCEAAAARGPGWCTRSPAGGDKDGVSDLELPRMQIH